MKKFYVNKKEDRAKKHFNKEVLEEEINREMTFSHIKDLFVVLDRLINSKNVTKDELIYTYIKLGNAYDYLDDVGNASFFYKEAIYLENRPLSKAILYEKLGLLYEFNNYNKEASKAYKKSAYYFEKVGEKEHANYLKKQLRVLDESNISR